MDHRLRTSVLQTVARASLNLSVQGEHVVPSCEYSLEVLSLVSLNEVWGSSALGPGLDTESLICQGHQSCNGLRPENESSGLFITFLPFQRAKPTLPSLTLQGPNREGGISCNLTLTRLLFRYICFNVKIMDFFF